MFHRRWGEGFLTKLQKRVRHQHLQNDTIGKTIFSENDTIGHTKFSVKRAMSWRVLSIIMAKLSGLLDTNYQNLTFPRPKLPESIPLPRLQLPKSILLAKPRGVQESISLRAVHLNLSYLYSGRPPPPWEV